MHIFNESIYVTSISAPSRARDREKYTLTRTGDSFLDFPHDYFNQKCQHTTHTAIGPHSHTRSTYKSQLMVRNVFTYNVSVKRFIPMLLPCNAAVQPTSKSNSYISHSSDVLLWHDKHLRGGHNMWW